MAEEKFDARGELKSLTSLRGVAAMSVAMNHFAATAQTHCRATIPALPPHGYVGVDFFFVLSGFIMGYTYLASFEREGIRAYGPFLAKRAARIVPLNVVTLAFLTVISLISTAVLGRDIFFPPTEHFGLDLLANLLMLQGLGIGTNLNGPSWSISVEFAAYLIFPLLLFGAFRSRTSAMVCALVSVAGISLLALNSPHLTLAKEGMPGSIIRCLTEFTLGLLAYRVSRIEAVRNALARDSVTIALSLIVLMSLVLRYDLPAVFAFPPLVISFAYNKGFPARIAQNRFIYFLGTISFSLYMLHGWLRPLELLALKAIAPDPVGPLTAMAFAVVGPFTAVPLAWLAYVAVENPGRHWLRSWSAAAGRITLARHGQA